jgi:hypothetical protein
VVAGPSHLKAGEKGGITARMSTFLQKGFITETIEVKSNDPKRPTIILTLQATILENILPLMQRTPVHS